jgi:hypothetical protein
MMEYGIEMKGETAFSMDGKTHSIPSKDIELSTVFMPEEEAYHKIFPAHDSEPLCAYVALDTYSRELSWKLGKVTNTLTAKSDYLNKLQRDLQAEEAAKLIGKDVLDYVDLVSETRQMAVGKKEFAANVRAKATLLPKPTNEHESMIRTMTQQTLRQELATRFGAKQLGRTNPERTTSALRSIAKSGDLAQDLNLLEAVRKTTIFESSAGIIGMAEAKVVEEYYPWIAELEAIATVVEKWTSNRMSFEAIPALKRVLPYGLTVETIKEIVEGKTEPENLTEKMRQSA